MFYIQASVSKKIVTTLSLVWMEVYFPNALKTYLSHVSHQPVWELYTVVQVYGYIDDA